MAVPKSDALQTLLSKFVCVRLVQMWGVDLAKFQFDTAMTWSIFYMNGDGTIYGRYGTRSGMRQQSSRDISLAGFQRSMAATLDLHAEYLRNPGKVRTQLAGKQTQVPPPWPQPQKIPTLAANKFTAKPFAAFAKERGLRAHGVGCIHCHMVQSAEIMSLRKSGKPVPEAKVWPYPNPWAIGLHMSAQHVARVQRVIQGSAAAAAGLQPGDDIVRFAGQPILSTADIQWVLHNTSNAGGELPVTIRRSGEVVAKTLLMTKGWRQGLGDWRFTNLGICMQIAGFRGRPTRGGNKQLRFNVQMIHRKRMAGIDLRRGDTILAVDGDRSPKNLGQMTWFLLGREPGSKLKLEVQRRGEGTHEIEVTLR